METTDYCSYELSKALKAAGFDEPCDHYYNGHSNLNRYADTDRINRNTNGHHTPSCSAPTLWQAAKWLREKHKWHIVIEPRIWEQQVYDYELWGFMRGYENANKGFDYLSYEQALSAGISAALELIKEGE